MHVFRNMHAGVKMGFNRSLLKGEAVASFPGSYDLLPALANKVLDKNLKPLPQNLHDTAWWVSQNWGLLAHPAPDAKARAARLRFTEAQIMHSRAFLERIRAPLATVNPNKQLKALTIVGTSRKTIDKAVWARAGVGGEKPVLVFTDEDFKSRGIPHRLDDLLVDGDESVTRESATLPAAYGTALNGPRELLTKAFHSAILKDGEVMDAVRNFLAL